MKKQALCAEEGCMQPVTGRCVGYKNNNCRRFYCSLHCEENLCVFCYRQKVNEQLAGKIYARYMKFSERIDKKLKEEFKDIGLQLSLVGLTLLSFLGGGMSVGPRSGDGAVFLRVFLSMTFLFFGLWVIIISKKYQRRLHEETAKICKFNLHFDQFYMQWRKGKNIPQYDNNIDSSRALLTAIAMSAVAQADDHVEHELRNSRNG